MISKAMRNLICAGAAAACSAFATPASAIAYDVGFDPTSFGGIVEINLDPSCLTPFPDTHSCSPAFDVLSANFTDSLGRSWDIAGPELGIGGPVTLDVADMLTAIDVSIFVQPVGFEIGCDGSTLQFALDGTVTFNCGGIFTDTGRVTSITRVPEPATFALLGLGLAGLAASRRRRPR